MVGALLDEIELSSDVFSHQAEMKIMLIFLIAFSSALGAINKSFLENEILEK